MKNTLIQLIQNDTTYNKNVTRYLYKTHPALWQQILEATSFLPNDAVAKQRCWHVLNDMWGIPKCPVTGSPVIWREKRYTPFSSMAAKNKGIGQILSSAIKGEKHWRKKDPTKSESANSKFTNGFKEGKHKPWHERDRDYAEISRKSKETWIKKYGVNNPSKDFGVRKKISDVHIANGATPRHLRKDKDLYYQAVDYFTEQSWKDYFDQINPQRINRTKNSLDHIYSKHEGFHNNIPPYIIGHWTNLRIISLSDNSAKGKRCDKTQDQLFEDFFQIR